MSTPDSHGASAFRVYFVLCAAYVASQFYRVANAAIAPELMADLSLSAEAMGAITGAFFLAFAAAQIPAGVLLDRYGPRVTMSGLFVVAALGAAVFAFADGALTLGIGRALMGLGCAAGLMGSMVAIARWYPPERFAVLSSMLFVYGGAGTILGTTPLAWGADVVGWRGAFYAMAGLTAFFAILLFAVVRDAPPGHAIEQEPPVTWPEIARGLREVLANIELWRVSAIQFVAYATVLTVIGLWAGPYLTDVHDLDQVDRGNILLVLNVAALLGVVIYSRIDRNVRARKWLIVGGALTAAAVLSVLALLPEHDFWPALILLSLFAVVANFVMLNHAHAREILPDHLVGRGLTLQNLAVFLGISTLQSVSGLIVGTFEGDATQAPEAAYRAVFAFLAVCLVIAAAIFSRARVPTRIGS